MFRLFSKKPSSADALRSRLNNIVGSNSLLSNQTLQKIEDEITGVLNNFLKIDSITVDLNSNNKRLVVEAQIQQDTAFQKAEYEANQASSVGWGNLIGTFLTGGFSFL